MDKVRIEINRSTREAMRAAGSFGDTYDSILMNAIKAYAPPPPLTRKEAEDAWFTAYLKEHPKK